MFFASYGSFMHSLLEQFYKGEITREEMKIKYLFDFRKNVLGERPKESVVSNYIKQGAAYIDNFEPFSYMPVAVEQKVDFEIGGNRFTGFIDYVGLDEPSGELCVIDHKSRDLKPRGKGKKRTQKDARLDEYLRQLYLYAAAVKNIHGSFPGFLIFNCFRTNTVIKEPFSQSDFNAALQWAENKAEEIKDADDLHPNIDFFSCKYICGVNHECCFYEKR